LAGCIKAIDKNVKKICVIGNSCSGKTRLARCLQKSTALPLYHVDSIQFLKGMQLRNPDETRRELLQISEHDNWIIDGFGPLNIIEDRFQKADLIIFIKLSLFRNYWWMLKRQVKSLFVRRSELPEGCFEATPAQTYKLITTIYNVHTGMWPQLDRIFQKEIYKHKVLFLRTSQELGKFCLELESKS
jgi:adenylate kinase family enzyme